MVNHRDYYYKYKTLKDYFKNNRNVVSTEKNPSMQIRDQNIYNQKQIKGGSGASDASGASGASKKDIITKYGSVAEQLLILLSKMMKLNAENKFLLNETVENLEKIDLYIREYLYYITSKATKVN